MPEAALGGHRKVIHSPVFWASILVGCAAFIAFVPSVMNGFARLDDTVLVTRNQYVLSPEIGDIAEVFGSFYRNVDYIPVTLLSYMAEGVVWGLGLPGGFHLDNVLLHVFNAVMVFLLLRLIFSSWIIPAGAALLFAVHPAHVESVTWISERKNVLSMAFMLISFYLYVRYTRPKQTKSSIAVYICALVAFVLAALSKPQALVLPLLLLLYQVCFGSDSRRRIVVSMVPYFAVALTIGLVTIIGQQKAGSLPLDVSGFGLRWFGPSVIVLRYLWSFTLPMHHAPYSWPLSFHVVPGWFIGLSIPVALLMIVIVILAWRRHRVLSFGLLWFGVSLVFVLHVIKPLNIVTADRHLYVPSVGLGLSLAYSVAWAMSELRSSAARIASRMATAIYSVIVLLFIVLSWLQIGVWKSDECLFRACILAEPDDARSHMYLGHVYSVSGKPQHAVARYAMAQLLEPGLKDIDKYLAHAYRLSGKHDKAISLLQSLTEQYPKDAALFRSLALSYSETGDSTKALRAIDRAIEIDEGNPDNYRDRGVILQKIGNPLRALRDFQKYVEMRPKDFAGLVNLAQILVEAKSDYETAEKYLNRALEINPSSSRAMFRLGKVYEKQSIQSSDTKKSRLLLKRAAEQYGKVALIRPDEPNLVMKAISTYAQLKQPDRARMVLEKAAIAIPTHFGIQQNLALVYLELGRTREALDRLQIALPLAPGNEARREILDAIENVKLTLSEKK